MELALIDRPSKEEFAVIVANALCVKDVVRALGYGTVNGANSATVKKRINEEHLDTSHFKRKATKTYTDAEVFRNNTEASQGVLRKRFKEGQYALYVCAICGQRPVWQDKPLTLILDHIDGNNKNGDLSNLRWVCPNCNQQLPTTGFHGVKYRDPDNLVQLPAAAYKDKPINTVKLLKRPSQDELLTNLFKHKFNFTQVGKAYEVSPNSVQKWLKFYNLPHIRSDIVSWYYINILNEQPPAKNVVEKIKTEPKAVLQYTKTGDFVNRYISASVASKSIFGDVVHASHISANCLNKRKSAYGYVWKFDT